MIELTAKEINRREELTFKLRDGNITYEEAEELKQILEREKEKAISINDIDALIAIGFFLTAVIGFLSDMDKKGKKKKKSK